MKIIIIILQAILNLVRKRRDLIANRSKIPPEYRDVVVWYSPNYLADNMEVIINNVFLCY